MFSKQLLKKQEERGTGSREIVLRIGQKDEKKE